MQSLRSVADKHGTDKGTQGPVRTWSAHNYSDVYEAYLWPLRDEPVNIMEIGIGVSEHRSGEKKNNRIVQGRNRGGGASLKMWSDYFVRSHVYGIDLDTATHLDTDRITTFVCDQSDDRDLASLVARLRCIEFDLIVDDGSHVAAHQQLTLSHLFPKLRSGGIYVIEDLNAESGGVIPTRTVLRAFQQHGRFVAPHSLVNEDYLAEEIEFIHFHAPEVRFRLRRGWLRPFRPIVRVLEYQPDSDRLCVIRKRASHALSQ
jgi:hypothetical protein